MVIFLIIYAIGLIGFFIHLSKTPKKERTNGRIWELFLLYQLVFSMGVTSFLAFFALTFMQDVVAQNTQWPSCPYQYELANVNLAYGILGILCIWYRKYFWSAVVIGFSIWIFADAIHHLVDAYVNDHYSDGNVGLLFHTDWMIPLILSVSLYYYHKTNNFDQNDKKKSIFSRFIPKKKPKA